MYKGTKGKKILYLFIFIYYILGVLGLDGLDKERKINIRKSISEGRVLKNENNSRRKRTNRNKLVLSNESFILIKNEENIKKELHVNLLSSRKPATQSSSYTGIQDVLGRASNAVDGGIMTNLFHATCTHTNTEDYPWWRVDLLDSYIITFIHIYNREDCCSERLHKINVMITNTTYTNPRDIPLDYRCGVEISGAPPKGQILKIACNNLIGRYVTVFINDKSSTLSLCEVQVYGRNISPCETGENDCNINNSKCVLKNQEHPKLGYTCECLEGFRKKNGNNSNECIDIDECEIGLDDCDPEKTECRNLEGSYECKTITERAINQGENTKMKDENKKTLGENKNTTKMTLGENTKMKDENKKTLGENTKMKDENKKTLGENTKMKDENKIKVFPQNNKNVTEHYNKTNVTHESDKLKNATIPTFSFSTRITSFFPFFFFSIFSGFFSVLFI